MTMSDSIKSGKNSSSTFEDWKIKNLQKIEEALTQALATRAEGAPPEVARLVEAMGYGLLGGGKRLRPLLALAAAEAVGGQAGDSLAAAAAVEMIHAYSLVHDDLPAMDDDDLRRGRPTCHKVYGEGLAILAGDALLTLAFEVLASNTCAETTAASRTNRALVVLAQAAGALGMVGGQALDLAFEGRATVSGDMVRDMEGRKTGALITSALVTGAILVGGGQSDLEKLRQIGQSLGLAFQIQDDLLNLKGDPAILGKAVGSDERRGKASFPAVLGREQAEQELARLIIQAQGLADSFAEPGRNLTCLVAGLFGRLK